VPGFSRNLEELLPVLRICSTEAHVVRSVLRAFQDGDGCRRQQQAKSWEFRAAMSLARL
jgi:hypothetical protein